MPVQKPLTALGLAVLALLAERPMHPYEMYQLLLDRHEDRLLKIRPGSLYHAVSRLEEAKLVVAQGTAREGNRPERTTYESTPAGAERLEARLREMLAVPAEEYPAFLLGIAEAHNLPREDVISLLTERRELLAATHRDIVAEHAEARGRDVAERYLLDLGYAQAVRQAEIDWLDRTINDLTSQKLPWQDART